MFYFNYIASSFGVKQSKNLEKLAKFRHKYTERMNLEIYWKDSLGQKVKKLEDKLNTLRH